MIFKYIQSSGQSHEGSAFNTDPRVLVCPTSSGIMKSAEAVPMTEEMRSFWDNYPKKDTERFLYLRVNILGAGEYWGSNLNGDYFPEDVLKRYHKTFHHARLFLHHQNKDPEKSHGRVIFSSYNDSPYAKRVEVIVAVDRKDPRIQEVIRKIENGEAIQVSMGCRVPFDVCSICRNRAATRAQYCEHLKKEMNRLYPDGRRVMAINLDPAFFDVSVVTIPADPSSGGMEKVASIDNVSSAVLGEIYFMSSKYAEAEKDKKEEKEAEIEKTGPGDKEEPKPVEVPEDVDEEKAKLRSIGSSCSEDDPDIPEDVLTRVADFPLNEIMGTMTGLGMPLRKKEFTCIIIKKASGDGAAKSAYRSGAEVGDSPPADGPSFDVIRDFNPKIASILMPSVRDRSMFRNFLEARNDRPKIASRGTKRRLDAPNGAAIYASYKRDAMALDSSKIAVALSMHPDLKMKMTGDLDAAMLHKSASGNNIFDECYMACELMKGALGWS